MSAAPESRYSRSEIEALCTKAARGAGFAWGLAEEAGMAARRLDEAGLPGPEWLLACLEGPRGPAPRIAGGRWLAEAPLCPILTGAMLADLGGALALPLRLPPVTVPGLLLPFLALVAARGAGGGVRMDWADGTARAGAGGLAADPPPPVAALTLIADTGPAALSPALPHPAPRRRRPAALWDALEALALATTVPPSVTSRTGAGAAGSDND